MAFDPGLAQLLRDDLAGEAVVETAMFGGLCFLAGGHMICGRSSAAISGSGNAFRPVYQPFRALATLGGNARTVARAKARTAQGAWRLPEDGG